MQDIAPIIAGVGIIVFLAHLFSGIFKHTRIPDVIFLISIGIIIGPISSLIPVSVFGEIGPVFATITLIIILFESGISLDLNSIIHAFSGAVKLALLTFILNMLVISCLALWLAHLSLLPALILGAILASTSEAIVIPLVKQLNLQDKSQSFLTFESTISSVLSIILTVALVETYKLGEFNVFHLTGSLIASFLLAALLGGVGAYLWSIILGKIRSLKNTMFTTAAFVFVIFGIVEILGFNGPIAALAFGITLSNLKSIRWPILKTFLSNSASGLTDIEMSFFSEIAFLLKTFFFVYLGMSLELISWQLVVIAVIFTIVVLLLRLVAVKYTLNGAFSAKDSSLIAVMIPRGLTAIILASIPFQNGMIDGESIKNITFGLVLLSILLTSVLIMLVNNNGISNYISRLISHKVANQQPGPGS
jgi:potassium/hydrogen antiporter